MDDLGRPLAGAGTIVDTDVVRSPASFISSTTKMHISWETFEKCIVQLQSLSDELNDNWVLHKTGNQEEFTTFLTKKQALSSDCLENASPIFIEYHVVYSIPYGAPILCMNSWRSNGTLLTMEELWKNFNFTENENMYSTLTQMDHAVLQRPFLTLHPCRTAELLEHMFLNSKNIIVSWLSAVGPIVRLDLDINYMKLT
ncbi:hypothetical protein Trydic_g17815 [Trypoxylus dichotomus]